MDRASGWAIEIFGGSKLKDARLRSRLVNYGGAQAADPTASTAQACSGSKAEREGAYRLLENDRVDPKEIDEGPYAHCARMCAGRRRLLAIQDTTSVKVHHQPLAESLAEEGSPTGFNVHSLLMVCGETGEVLGVADQMRWIREKSRPGKEARRQRDYRDKESAKWEAAAEAGRSRIGGDAQWISVADREADIYEFLSFHVGHRLDFVVRASWNRRIAEDLGHVFDAVREAPVIGERLVRIEQRGAQRARYGQRERPARPRRDVRTQLQATSVTLRPPRNRSTHTPDSIEVHVVRVAEVDAVDHDAALEWILLTSLPIDSPSAIERVVRDYEQRWLIEQFFKCWKTGCRLEARPLQSLNAVERMMAITAPIAVRILQLQIAAAQPASAEQPAPLGEDEWRCLWVTTSNEPLPKSKPSASWAYTAVAKLGGWYDSKGTGRAGWQALWTGWMRLQQRLAGWQAANQAAQM